MLRSWWNCKIQSKWLSPCVLPLKKVNGTVSRDWIGPCIVLMDRPQLVHHCICRVGSQFFNGFLILNTGIFASNWPPVACKNSMQLAASRILIVVKWPPVAYKLYRVAANRMQIEKKTGICLRVQFACDWRPLGYNLNATGRQLRAKPRFLNGGTDIISLPSGKLFNNMCHLSIPRTYEILQG
jgi:hypothetical protein